MLVALSFISHMMTCWTLLPDLPQPGWQLLLTLLLCHPHVAAEQKVPPRPLALTQAAWATLHSSRDAAGVGESWQEGQKAQTARASPELCSAPVLANF